MKAKKELKKGSEEELAQVTGGVLYGGGDGQQNPPQCEQPSTQPGTGGKSGMNVLRMACLLTNPG